MQDTLARKLRVLRAERGLTLREAAQRTGVDKDTLSKLERGIRHPHDVTISRLAKGYDVPVEELLEDPALAGTPGKAEALVGLGIDGLSTEELREEALGTLIPAYRLWKRAMTTPTKVTEHETDAGDSETAEAG